MSIKEFLCWLFCGECIEENGHCGHCGQPPHCGSGGECFCEELREIVLKKLNEIWNFLKKFYKNDKKYNGTLDIQNVFSVSDVSVMEFDTELDKRNKNLKNELNSFSLLYFNEKPNINQIEKYWEEIYNFSPLFKFMINYLIKYTETKIEEYNSLHELSIPIRKYDGKNPIKVAYISVYNTACGIATYNQEIISEIQKGVNVKVFAEYANATNDPDYVVRCWSRNEHPKTELIKAVEEFNPDVIHFSHEYGFFPKAYQFTNLVSKFKSMGYPVISTMHSVYEHLDKLVQESVSDLIIAHTDSAKKCLINKGINPERIHVVAHGSKMFGNDLLPNLWNTWDNNYTIFQPGFLFGYKGHLRMLDVVAQLKVKYPLVQYVVQGSENPQCMPEHDRLYKQMIDKIKELGIEENVTINRGFVSEEVLMSHIRTMKCVVLPYLKNEQHEVRGTSGVARLVLTTSTPLIVSDVHLFDDLEGIVPHVGNDEELFQEIDKIFTNNGLTQEQITLRKQFLQDTSWDKIGKQLVDVYKNIL